MTARVLGLSAWYHDSAAALVDGNEIVAAAQEERFTRIKQDSGFPAAAAQWCLEHANFRLDDLDAIVFYEKPLLKFERLVSTYLGFSPKGWDSFHYAIPERLRGEVPHEQLALHAPPQ